MIPGWYTTPVYLSRISMKYSNQLNFIVLAVCICVIMLPQTKVHAGDEDMNPTAYHRFDPVTGYMIPIEEPPQGQQDHSQTTAPVTAQTNGMNQTTNATEDTVVSNSIWLYILASLTIIVGLAAWIRGKGTGISSSNLD